MSFSQQTGDENEYATSETKSVTGHEGQRPDRVRKKITCKLVYTDCTLHLTGLLTQRNIGFHRLLSLGRPG